MKQSIVHIARDYASAAHTQAAHMYGKNLAYTHHLKMTWLVGFEFRRLIENEKRSDVLAACWTHDAIEDARQSYNDVKKATNKRIADITYALTNEKGKTRAERANDAYYEGIRSTPGAVFVKLCDRIANVEFSKESGSSMFEKYKKENESFISRLKPTLYAPMVEYLNDLLEEK